MRVLEEKIIEVVQTTTTTLKNVSENFNAQIVQGIDIQNLLNLAVTSVLFMMILIPIIEIFLRNKRGRFN